MKFYLLAIVFGALLLFGGVQTFRLNTAQTTISKLESESIKVAKQHAEDLLEQERETNTRIANLLSRHLDTQQEANEQYEKVIGDFRTANLRLHERLVCPNPNSGASTDPGRSSSTSGAGLLEEDVQFLVSEAKRADDVVRQLTLTQELLLIYKRHYAELKAKYEATIR